MTDISVSGAFTLGSATGVLQATNGLVSALVNGGNGQVLKIAAGVPTWAADNTGSGGSSAWATTSDNLAIVESDPTDVVVIGASATTTTSNILEVASNSLFRGTVTAYKTATAPSFTATSTTASQLPYASTTALTATNASTPTYRLCLPAQAAPHVGSSASSASFSTTAARTSSNLDFNSSGVISPPSGIRPMSPPRRRKQRTSVPEGS